MFSFSEAGSKKKSRDMLPGFFFDIGNLGGFIKKSFISPFLAGHILRNTWCLHLGDPIYEIR